MGPEYFEEGEEKYYGTEGDIWSLGCVFYEMCILELKNPVYIEIFKNQQDSFNKMIQRDVKKHYSQKLADIIVSTLQKDPRKRPNAQELLEMIEGTRSPITSQGKIGENLIKNPTGKDGLDNWKVITQNGSGWVTEESGSDCPNNISGLAFATSNDWCTREQMIDLKLFGFTEEILDNEPDIYISDWYKGREGSSSSFKIAVYLYDSKMVEIAKFINDNLPTEEKWKEVSTIFKNYGPGLRFIKFIDGGKDNNMMKGHYGALITNSSVILKPRSVSTQIQKQPTIDKAWSKISYSNSPIVPTERSAFSIVCYNDNYYMFGGHDSKKIYADFYEFSPNTGKWALLESPELLKRSHHSAILYKDSMYILGGNKRIGYLKDFHQYDFSQKKWIKLEPLPSVGRRGMSILIYKDALYVFGGFDGSKFLNEMLKYDFSKSQWEIIKTTGDIIEREACSFVEYKDTFYIFGGLTKNGHSNDLYTFSNGTFTKIIPAGISIKPRAFHSTVLLKDKIFIFGGHSQEGWSDDFYVYDIETNLFSEINNLGACPTKRAGHKMVERNGQMILCGGFSAPNYYNDMFLCK